MVGACPLKFHRQDFCKRPPEEVANMVVYVCSKEASATTGAALRVDGGVVRAIG
jgi:NAD(P)-dependent dehydrogenase (short-subunit alcohol dehydrogenase family)